MQINWQMGCCALTAQKQVGNEIILLTRMHGAEVTRVERFSAVTNQATAPAEDLPNEAAEQLLA